MEISRVGVNDRIERFSRLTKSVETKGDLFAASSALQLNSAEQYATYTVLSGPLYETLYSRALSSVLMRLDSLVAGGGASYEYETITVEHVLPQSPLPNSEWLTWFPNPEIRASSVHQLGTLVLLTRKKNSSASNYEFARKKEAYFTRGGVSPFALTTQVLQYSEWKPEIVTARQIELLEILDKHWDCRTAKTQLSCGRPKPRMKGMARGATMFAKLCTDSTDGELCNRSTGRLKPSGVGLLVHFPEASKL